MTINKNNIRKDLVLVANMIERKTKVLDVGCGDGDFLQYLKNKKDVDGRGIEISQNGVKNCLAKGLSVIQGNAEIDLEDFPEKAFDYVILSQTLQEMRKPRDMLEKLLRVGKRAFVSLPNFGYWKVRLKLLIGGRMPVTKKLSHTWYDTPNIHFCTLKDFVNLCDKMEIEIERAIGITDNKSKTVSVHFHKFSNLLAEQCVFLIRDKE